jgi:NAD-dependent SIR2 family protein deacetylase
MRIFICGIIQGSHRELAIHGQSYRARIKEMLARTCPRAEIYCPVDLHPDSLAYDDPRAFKVFHESVQEAKRSDILIAYLPSASMGSAIEMWEAKQAGVKIISITPLQHNWVVRYASDVILKDLDEFERSLESGALAGVLQ